VLDPASEAGYDVRACCRRDARHGVEDGEDMADEGGVITSWGTIRTFLEVGT
jgi:hypothetical protein